LRKALGLYWFHHSRTRFDGRYHRCPDREEFDLEINRRPYQRMIGGRAYASGVGPRSWRSSWIAVASAVFIQAVLAIPAIAGAVGSRGTLPATATEEIFLNVATMTETNPKAEAGNGPLASWLGRELSGGRYRLLEVVSEGPAGTSFRARDLKHELDVLIEVPHAPATEPAAFAERFSQGVRRHSLLDQSHLVKVVEVGESGHWPFAVMEYHQGGSLKFRRPTGKDGRPSPASPKGLSVWLLEVAEVLDFLHARGHVHRDVRPANIVFDDQGNVHLGGLGMSEAIRAANEARPAQARNLANLTFGAPGYMAPELAAGLPVDGQADQYALAAIVYELLGSRLPFEGHSAMAVLIQQLTREPLDLHRLRPDISRALSQAVLRGLSRDPRARFPDCGSFAREVLSAAVVADNQGLTLIPAPTSERKSESVPNGVNRSPPGLRIALHWSWRQSAWIFLGITVCTLLLRKLRYRTYESRKDFTSSCVTESLRVYTLVELQEEPSLTPAPLPMLVSSPATYLPDLVQNESRVHPLAIVTRQIWRATLVFKRIVRKNPLPLTQTSKRHVERSLVKIRRDRHPVPIRAALSVREARRKNRKSLQPLQHRAG